MQFRHFFTFLVLKYVVFVIQLDTREIFIMVPNDILFSERMLFLKRNNGYSSLDHDTPAQKKMQMCLLIDGSVYKLEKNGCSTKELTDKMMMLDSEDCCGVDKFIGNKKIWNIWGINFYEYQRRNTNLKITAEI